MGHCIECNMILQIEAMISGILCGRGYIPEPRAPSESQMIIIFHTIKGNYILRLSKTTKHIISNP